MPSAVRRAARRPVTVLVVLVVCTVSLLPQTGASASISGPAWLESLLLWDKLHHGFAYAVLAALFARPARSDRQAASTPAGVTLDRQLLIAAGAAVVLGTAVELAQLSIPSRQFSVADLAANAVGATVGVVIVRLRRR